MVVMIQQKKKWTFNFRSENDKTPRPPSLAFSPSRNPFVGYSGICTMKELDALQFGTHDKQNSLEKMIVLYMLQEVTTVDIRNLRNIEVLECRSNP